MGFRNWFVGQLSEAAVCLDSPFLQEKDSSRGYLLGEKFTILSLKLSLNPYRQAHLLNWRRRSQSY